MTKEITLGPVTILAKKRKIAEGNNSYISKAWDQAENNVGEIFDFLKFDGISLSMYGLERDGYFYAGFELKEGINPPSMDSWSLITIEKGPYLCLEIGDDYSETLAELKDFASKNGIEVVDSPLDHGDSEGTFIYLPIVRHSA